MRTQLVIVGLFVACVSSGCATSNILSLARWKHSIPRASRKNPATRVLCLWQAAEGRGMDNLPTRGFSGQIYFFRRNDDAPVAVDGDMRIFVFDDQGEPGEQAKPIHQFDFKGKACEAFLSDSQIGVGYSLFIPYTRKGFHHAKCSLQVRLISENGPTIYSDMAHVTLPGSKKEPANSDDSKSDSVAKIDRSKTRVDTIDVNRHKRSGHSQSMATRQNVGKADSRSGISNAAIREFQDRLRQLNQSNAAPRQFADRRVQPITDGSEFQPDQFRVDQYEEQDDGQPFLDREQDRRGIRWNEQPQTERRHVPRFRLGNSKKITAASYERTVEDDVRSFKDFEYVQLEERSEPVQSHHSFRGSSRNTRTTQTVHPLLSDDD